MTFRTFLVSLGVLSALLVGCKGDKKSDPAPAGETTAPAPATDTPATTDTPPATGGDTAAAGAAADPAKVDEAANTALRIMAVVSSSVRGAKGKIEDVNSFHKSIMSAPSRFKSPRGDFKFAHNGTPIQDYYLRIVAKDNKGRIVNKKMGTVMTAHQDFWAKDCKMK